MSDLSQKDKHSPGVQTGQPNPEQPNQPLKAPQHQAQMPPKKEVQNKERDRDKTATR